MLPWLLAAFSPFTAILTLSGETIAGTDSGSPFDSTAGIRFNTDGTVEKGEEDNGGGIVWTQMDAATDWIIPNGAATSDFEVRYTNRVGTPDFTTSAAAEDSWVDMSTQRVWLWNETTSGNKTFDADFEMRRGSSGSAEASATYTFNIFNTP